MDILYRDNSIVVCIKPAGVLSTDEEGGMPSLLRAELGTDCVRSVHRLDRVVSGVMVYALTPASASELSRQIREDGFSKEYLAVIKGCPEEKEGVFKDLLFKDSRKNKSFVVTRERKGVKEASLEYRVLDSHDDTSLVLVKLHTGRTHQIRVQFASRKMPLLGDGKYGSRDNKCETALWSCRLTFNHPMTGENVCCTSLPPRVYPWNNFAVEI